MKSYNKLKNSKKQYFRNIRNPFKKTLCSKNGKNALKLKKNPNLKDLNSNKPVNIKFQNLNYSFFPFHS